MNPVEDCAFRVANRRVRVFVSSTFRDMMEERDTLMTHAWPELRLFCRERQVELIEVDLRWGVTEEQSTRRETLKFCLDEIRACRPFFVGLLGERYGWVPGDDAVTDDLREEQPWLENLRGRSVTELEILHGVLNNPEMAGHSFFYFRDPAHATARGPDFLPENPETAEKQSALKARIRSANVAGHCAIREPYSDPVQLTAFVLEDLRAAIEAEFSKESVPDPLTREARDHESYGEIRRRTYIGRAHYFAALDAHAACDGAPLVVLGDSGGGKSALLANWLKRWRGDHPRDFIVQHYVGSTPDSADHWRLMARLIAEIKRWTSDPEELPSSHDDLLKTFPVWLAKARIKAGRDGVRCILVLDALNQLEDRDHARLLGWLPPHPFTGPLRLIVSTLPGDTLQAVEGRGWTALRVVPLTPYKRRRMIAEYLARFGKRLAAPRLERLAAAPASANPLFLKILLDELRVTGTHDRLDERLGDYLDAPDIPALVQKVLTRYQRDYERDRPGLVAEALGLLWAARRGLTETELLRLLCPEDLPHLPLATWAPLRAALEEGLVDRAGILNFAHDFIRAAVQAAFVSDEDKRDDFRLQLADYFEAQPVSARSCDELPWLLWQTDARDRLRACLLGIDRFLEIKERDRDELIRYWVWLGEERTMGSPYLVSFEAWSRESNRADTEISVAANALGTFLESAALFAEAEPLYRRALAVDEQSYGPDHPSVAKDLNAMAGLFYLTNRLAESEPLTRRALTINEQSRGPDHPDMVGALNSLASVLQATSRWKEAEPLLRRAVVIAEQSHAPDHPAVIASLNCLALLLQSTRRMAEAESLFRRALTINEQSRGPDHPDVARELNNLAGVLQATSRWKEAEPLLRRALDIDERAYGSNHPVVGTCLNNLASLLKGGGQLAEAESLYCRALAIDKQSYGPDHPQVARDL
ncbi:MAG: tetratricopeptide repeat protein, partial [bacterium]